MTSDDVTDGCAPTSPGRVLARIIHEGFYCNRRSAATTSLTAGGLAVRLVNILLQVCFPPSRARLWNLPRLAAPRARLGPPPSPSPILWGREGWGAGERS